MKQSKLESLVESVVNTCVGLVITIIVYPIINYSLDIKMSAAQVSLSTLLFTIVSVIRGFVIRRFFNNLYVIKHWISDLIK